MKSYIEIQRMPTLQELADMFNIDNDFEYVHTNKKELAAVVEPFSIGNSSSIFVKLEDYTYEFEIDNSLRLASIDGVKLAVEPTPVQEATTQSYNIDDILTLETGVKSITGSIQKSGKVVNMNLLVKFNSKITAGTYANFARFKNTDFLPADTVYGFSAAAETLGNACVKSDGTLSLRHGRAITDYMFVITYILP